MSRIKKIALLIILSASLPTLVSGSGELLDIGGTVDFVGSSNYVVSPTTAGTLGSFTAYLRCVSGGGVNCSSGPAIGFVLVKDSNGDTTGPPFSTEVDCKSEFKTGDDGGINTDFNPPTSVVNVPMTGTECNVLTTVDYSIFPVREDTGAYTGAVSVGTCSGSVCEYQWNSGIPPATNTRFITFVPVLGTTTPVATSTTFNIEVSWYLNASDYVAS